MAATYTPIASITLGAAASSVTFSSIPSTYTDLVLISYTGNSDSGANNTLKFNVNSDTGTNYSFTELAGNGTSVLVTRQSSIAYGALGYNNTPDDVIGNFVSVAHFMNYSNTTTFKTILSRENSLNSGYPGTGLLVNLWRSTSAINSINVALTANNLISGSTFNLYGILGANA